MWGRRSLVRLHHPRRPPSRTDASFTSSTGSSPSVPARGGSGWSCQHPQGTASRPTRQRGVHAGASLSALLPSPESACRQPPAGAAAHRCTSSTFSPTAAQGDDCSSSLNPDALKPQRSQRAVQRASCPPPPTASSRPSPSMMFLHAERHGAGLPRAAYELRRCCARFPTASAREYELMLRRSRSARASPRRRLSSRRPPGAPRKPAALLLRRHRRRREREYLARRGARPQHRRL